jgi:hypothetical protein
LEEKRVICYEALYSIAGEVVRTIPVDIVHSIVDGALGNYTSTEGARSLYRTVSHELVDNI